MKIQTLLIAIILAATLTSCQTFSLKRGWDSVKVSDTPLWKVQTHSSGSNFSTYQLPTGYWSPTKP
jgi:hypothetical protein